MKKITLITIAIFCISIAKTQNYIPLLEEYKTWSTGSSGCDPYFQLVDSHFIKFVGDSVIDGKHYKKVMKSVYPLNNNNWALFGFIREDTTTKQIFSRKGAYEEQMMNDFSVSKGDTITVGNPLCVTDHTAQAVVDSVYFEEFAGKNRKHILLHNVNFSSIFIEKWIEGIGSMTGVDKSCYTIIGFLGDNLRLICYHENDELLYINAEKCYYGSHTAVENEEASKTIIYPNPANGFLNISWNDVFKNEVSVIIYNILGQKVYQNKFDANKAETIIDINNLQKGMYVLVISDDNKEEVHKVMME